jgi:hypothetical protein
LLRLLSCSSSSTDLSVCSEVEETLRGTWSCFFFRVLLGKEKCQLQRALPIESFPIPAAYRSSTRRLKNPTLRVSVTDDDDDELLLQKSWPQLSRRSVSITSDEVASHCYCRQIQSSSSASATLSTTHCRLLLLLLPRRLPVLQTLA